MRLSSRHTYRPERGALRGFHVACVRNEAISRRHRTSGSVALERRARSGPIRPAGADHRVDTSESISIRATLATLPREQRDVIELAYSGQYTEAESALRPHHRFAPDRGGVSYGFGDACDIEPCVIEGLWAKAL